MIAEDVVTDYLIEHLPDQVRIQFQVGLDDDTIEFRAVVLAPQQALDIAASLVRFGSRQLVGKACAPGERRYE